MFTFLLFFKLPKNLSATIYTSHSFWLILCFVTDTFVSNRFNKDVPYLSVIANNVIWCLAS